MTTPQSAHPVRPGAGAWPMPVIRLLWRVALALLAGTASGAAETAAPPPAAAEAVADGGTLLGLPGVATRVTIEELLARGRLTQLVGARWFVAGVALRQDTAETQPLFTSEWVQLLPARDGQVSATVTLRNRLNQQAEVPLTLQVVGSLTAPLTPEPVTVRDGERLPIDLSAVLAAVSGGQPPYTVQQMSARGDGALELTLTADASGPGRATLAARGLGTGAIRLEIADSAGRRVQMTIPVVATGGLIMVPAAAPLEANLGEPLDIPLTLMSLAAAQVDDARVVAVGPVPEALGGRFTATVDSIQLVPRATGRHALPFILEDPGSGLRGHGRLVIRVTEQPQGPAFVAQQAVGSGDCRRPESACTLATALGLIAPPPATLPPAPPLAEDPLGDPSPAPGPATPTAPRTLDTIAIVGDLTLEQTLVVPAGMRLTCAEAGRCTLRQAHSGAPAVILERGATALDLQIRTAAGTPSLGVRMDGAGAALRRVRISGGDYNLYLPLPGSDGATDPPQVIEQVTLEGASLAALRIGGSGALEAGRGPSGRVLVNGLTITGSAGRCVELIADGAAQLTLEAAGLDCQTPAEHGLVVAGQPGGTAGSLELILRGFTLRGAGRTAVLLTPQAQRVRVTLSGLTLTDLPGPGPGLDQAGAPPAAPGQPPEAELARGLELDLTGVTQAAAVTLEGATIDSPGGRAVAVQTGGAETALNLREVVMMAPQGLLVRHRHLGDLDLSLRSVTAGTAQRPGGIGLELDIQAGGRVDALIEGLQVVSAAAEAVRIVTNAPQPTSRTQALDLRVALRGGRLRADTAAVFGEFRGFGAVHLAVERLSLVAQTFAVRLERRDPVTVCADIEGLNGDLGARDPRPRVALYNGVNAAGLALTATPAQVARRSWHRGDAEVLLSGVSPAAEASIAARRCQLRRPRL